MKASFDITVCTECSYDMDKGAVRDVIENGIPAFFDGMEAEGVSIDEVRARVIGFGDYSSGTDAVKVGNFVHVVGGNEYFGTSGLVAELDALPFIGGVGRCNALEALFEAYHLDPSSSVGGRRRHVILLFAESEVLPLEAHRELYGYGGDAPDSLAGLSDWLTGCDPCREKPESALAVLFISDRGRNRELKEELAALPLTFVTAPESARELQYILNYGVLFEDW